MADRNEKMEVSGGEDMESEYLQKISATFDDNLEDSADSLQGNLTLPTFAFDQSNELQGSQGFKFVNVADGGERKYADMLDSCPRDGQNALGQAPSIPVQVIANQIVDTRSAGIQGISDIGNILNSAGSVSKETIQAFLLQNSRFHPLVTGENVRSTAREILPNSLLVDAQEVTKAEAQAHCSQGDSGEGASSDEKSGKTKSSPKRRGRKGRCTSSTGSDMDVKSEVVQMAQVKSEPNDQQHGTESGFRPSLEEIMTEKKMALMKSPEVMQFLREQQHLVAQQKRSSQQHTSS